ncbi:MAG: aminoacyl-tRNA hydrolase [Chloroflexi bacterium]|nr:aminoacyl-tRNA hydrolase [Chloroflexota bacterium]
MASKLIAGLGNPGSQYARTRHNLGFLCIDTFAERHGLKFTKKRARALVAEGTLDQAKLILAKPQTYMNLSGESVKGLLSWYRLGPPDLLVVYDDLDLPLGKIRIREKGSAGGHKGIQSLTNWLKTDDFARIRVGIGRPTVGDEIDYVLTGFRQEEWPIIDETRRRVTEAVEAIIKEGIVAAMNVYNR